MGHMTAPVVGVIGLGSIGRRHARELAALGATVVALRRRDSAESGPDDRYVEEIRDEERFWARSFDAIIVANPTSLHVETALRCLERSDARILVEKPLGSTSREAEAIAAEARPRVRVAYCLRFHPVVRTISELLAAGMLGKIVAGRLRFGSHLSAWHPDRDYRVEYAALRVLGGGVLRTLSHEIDLLQHWLGPAESVAGAVGHVSELEVDVEDIAQLCCRTRSGAMVAVDLDFLTPGYDRVGQLVGTRGRLDYSLDPCRLDITTPSGVRSYRFDASEDMYSAQARDVLAWACGNESTACTFDDAVHVLRIVEAAENTAWAPVESVS